MARKIFYLVFVTLFISTSCVRYKNITYIQDRFEVDSVKVKMRIDTPEDIILEAGNNLYIDLSGIEGMQHESFSKGRSYGQQITDLILYFQGYIIDEEGYIELPVIGKLFLAGKTFKEAKKLIQNQYAEFLKGVIVDVRLVSYKVTILGEVKRSGEFVFYKQNINILDLLAQAGELTNYGDARSILVVRNKGANSESVMVDLTNTRVFENDYFWLEPNDIVYVKPLRAKMFSVNSPTISLFFSTVSLLIVVATFLKL